MSRKQTERLCDEIRQIADRLSEGDEDLRLEEVRNHLREIGIDPDGLKKRFHEAVRKLVEREATANRFLSLALKQAIDTTRPDDQMPNAPAAAVLFMERWLDKFVSPFVLPANIEVARAYRKSDDLADPDRVELDRLEEDLKNKVKRENERES